MNKTMVAAALLLATTGVASAGGEPGSIGLGAERSSAASAASR
jgi:hypothetical protein